MIIRLTFLGLLLLCSACSRTRLDIPLQKQKEISRDIALRQSWAAHYPAPSESLLQRIQDAPPPVLEYLRRFDNRPDYSNYQPTPEEIQLIQAVLDFLPPLNRVTLEKHLLAIHFINGFIGSGMADCFYDETGQKAPVIILNPDTLRDSLSARVLYRELSAYQADDSGMTLTIDCGQELSGLHYVLLHESTHVVDYMYRVNPYVENGILLYDLVQGQRIPAVTPFMRGYWKSYKVPDGWDFTQRKRLKYYGLGGGPQIPMGRIEQLYLSLLQSPCVSLYSTVNWAEDLADFVTFYHLTQQLGQPYTLTLSSNGRTLMVVRPMDNPQVKKRFALIRHFYR